ncbi:MAG: hypothetical protein KGK34_02160 [Chloroflexota bacterium]|nr:hypothetical protein [Chloroflexota bacterium]
MRVIRAVALFLRPRRDTANLVLHDGYRPFYMASMQLRVALLFSGLLLVSACGSPMPSSGPPRSTQPTLNVDPVPVPTDDVVGKLFTATATPDAGCKDLRDFSANYDRMRRDDATRRAKISSLTSKYPNVDLYGVSTETRARILDGAYLLAHSTPVTTSFFERAVAAEEKQNEADLQGFFAEGERATSVTAHLAEQTRLNFEAERLWRELDRDIAAAASHCGAL